MIEKKPLQVVYFSKQRCISLSKPVIAKVDLILLTGIFPNIAIKINGLHFLVNRYYHFRIM
jgi:hypothetical protein